MNITVATDYSLKNSKYPKSQPLSCILQADTSKKPVPPSAASADLKTKILDIWKDFEGENATFEIKPNSIYYFEHSAAYKYILTGDVINIKFPDYTFTGKVSFVNGIMVFNSKKFGLSKYNRMK